MLIADCCLRSDLLSPIHRLVFQVRRDGYTHRLPFKDFWDRYRGLAFNFSDDKKMYAKNNDPKYNHAAQFRVAGNPKVLDLWLGLDCLIV